MIEYLEQGDIAIVNGIKFRRDKKTGYYLSSSQINGKRKRLHVYVWELYNGTVPEGYNVHHKDHDKSNNDISNLELLTAQEHKKRHGEELSEAERQERRETVTAKAMPKAIEWHSSDKGRKWHKEHYEAMKDKLYIKEEYICIECGKKFTAIKGNSKFCSNNCKSMYRRKSGVDNVERKCKVCGNTFIANKYSAAKYCEEHKGKGGHGRRDSRCI